MQRPDPPIIDASNASERLRGYIRNTGPIPVRILIGGVMCAIGTLLPFASMYLVYPGEQRAMYLAGRSSLGLLSLIVPLVLAVLPQQRKLAGRYDLTAFGVSCAMLGTVIAVWQSLFTPPGLPAVEGVAGTTVRLAAGFYISIAGYVTLISGYFSLVRERSHYDSQH